MTSPISGRITVIGKRKHQADDVDDVDAGNNEKLLQAEVPGADDDVQEVQGPNAANKDTVTDVLPVENSNDLNDPPALPLEETTLDAVLNQDTEPRKKLEVGMRRMAETDGCRRDVSDIFFQNPTPSQSWTCRERIGQAVLDHTKFVNDVWYETQGVVNPSARALETCEETQACYNSNKHTKYSSQKPVPGKRILTYTAPSQSLKTHLAPSLPLAFDVTEAARPSMPLPCATPTAQPSMMPPSAMPFKFTSGHSPPKSRVLHTKIAKTSLLKTPRATRRKPKPSETLSTQRTNQNAPPVASLSRVQLTKSGSSSDLLTFQDSDSLLPSHIPSPPFAMPMSHPMSPSQHAYQLSQPLLQLSPPLSSQDSLPSEMLRPVDMPRSRPKPRPVTRNVPRA
ncbi:hypothetical protein BC835DRAFT_1409761 [Cytidiella melzeri]|nr:hypothetical protein BC835DRAFT_1409761 [Cytidiella melzeri]